MARKSGARQGARQFDRRPEFMQSIEKIVIVAVILATGASGAVAVLTMTLGD